MKIALCIKQIPDTTDIRWTENNTIQREGVESVINPYDVYAMDFALKLKSQLEGSTVTVFTMGPLQADNMLRKALALGCDDAVLISDRKFAGADTYATGLTISSAIKTVADDFDLVVCGQFAVDGDTAQTGPIIANFLGLPQVTYVKSLVSIEEKSLVLTRELEDGIENVRVSLPALVCIMMGNYEAPRPLIDGVIKASKKEIKVLSMTDISLAPERCGLKGSPTYVSRAFRNVSTHVAHKYNLNVEESVKLLDSTLQMLEEKK